MNFSFFHSARDQPPIRIPALGLDLFVRLPPTASGGGLTVLETVNASGFGPPLHRHHETEIFRVLAGRYLYECDGKRFHAEEGDVVCIPGGAAHAFVNVTDRPARQLVIMEPGMDAAAFFAGLGEVLKGGSPGRDILNQFGAPWGVEFLGPPLQPG